MSPLPPLIVRLSESLKAFINSPISGGDLREASRAAVADLVFRKRVENSVITPETEQAKSLRLMVEISDTGRAVRFTNIRILRLHIGVRGNAKTELGKADPFNTACGALESLLDLTNLAAALTSAPNAIKVFHAARQPGVMQRINGDVREDCYLVEIKAIGLEHTNAVQLEDGTYRTTEGGELVTTEG